MPRHAMGTAPLRHLFVPVKRPQHPCLFMGVNRGHPHGLPQMLQHLQHGGTHAVKSQPPRLLFQCELNVVAAFPLKTHVA